MSTDRNVNDSSALKTDSVELKIRLQKSRLIFMDSLVISQAKKLGFTCQLNDEALWEIYASNPQERWKITQFEDRWLLSIAKIPQMYLTSSEVELFLLRRSSFLKKI